MVASSIEIAFMARLMASGTALGRLLSSPRSRRALLPYIPALVVLLLALRRALTLSRDRHRTRILCRDSDDNRRLLALCPSLHAYVPPPLLPGPHLNTLFSALLRRHPGLAFRRTTLPLADGGHVTLDWRGTPAPGTPILLVLHGLTGGSEERYAQHMIEAAEAAVREGKGAGWAWAWGGEEEARRRRRRIGTESGGGELGKGGAGASSSSSFLFSPAAAAGPGNGAAATASGPPPPPPPPPPTPPPSSSSSPSLPLCCVVMNARGCSGTSVSSPRCFSGAWTADVRAAVAHIRGLVGDEAPLLAVGYSLGAGVLTKFVCEEGAACQLDAAVACCASFDFHRSAARLESWGSGGRLYNSVLAGNLRAFLARHAEQFSAVEGLSLSAARAARTVREFDAATICPMFGYADTRAYYEDASSARLLERARIPLLLLNAEDDPICDSRGLPEAKVRASERTIAVLTREGGHVAWCAGGGSVGGGGGWWPTGRSWENEGAVEFFMAVLGEGRRRKGEGGEEDGGGGGGMAGSPALSVALW
jgi:predicted alpha/beta-fold hydrolase